MIKCTSTYNGITEIIPNKLSISHMFLVSKNFFFVLGRCATIIQSWSGEKFFNYKVDDRKFFY